MLPPMRPRPTIASSTLSPPRVAACRRLRRARQRGSGSVAAPAPSAAQQLGEAGVRIVRQVDARRPGSSCDSSDAKSPAAWASMSVPNVSLPAGDRQIVAGGPRSAGGSSRSARRPCAAARSSAGSAARSPASRPCRVRSRSSVWISRSARSRARRRRDVCLDARSSRSAWHAIQVAAQLVSASPSPAVRRSGASPMRRRRPSLASGSSAGSVPSCAEAARGRAWCCPSTRSRWARRTD